jgi:signal transduction histidine kinase/ActR/RegA family two-component response regulator
MEHLSSVQDDGKSLSVRLELILRQGLIVIPGTLLDLIFYVIFMWQEPFRFQIVIWAIVFGFVTVTRYFYCVKWHKRPSDQLVVLTRRHLFFVLGAAASGTFWGMLGWFYFEATTSIGKSASLFLLAGTVAGSIGAYSPSIAIMNAFIIPALTPLIIRSFYSGETVNLLLGIISLVFLFNAMKLAKNFNRTTLETIRLSAQNEALRAERRASSRLLANVSHEIRTPLAAIEGYAGLLELDLKLDDKAREHLSTIKRSTVHLLSVVDDVLDLSRLHAGKRQVHYSWFSPKDEIDELLRLLEPANNHKLAINLKGDPSVPEKVYSDVKIFRQVLINLVTNALKFTPSGQINISLHTMPRGRNNYLVVEVADTGIGIEDNEISQLFQPFSRASDDYVLGKRGSGLGLALAKDLAQLVGGDLILKKSVVGSGSTFAFSFDVSFAPSTKIRDEAPAGSIGTANLGTLLSGLSVLVVDDSPDLLALLQQTLRNYGSRVDTCENGKLALDKVKEDSYDLVLMDLSMPAMDGYQAVAQLRATGYHRPIIALTAHSSEEYRKRCLEVGFDAFLKKPISLDELRLAILECRKVRSTGDDGISD